MITNKPINHISIPLASVIGIIMTVAAALGSYYGSQASQQKQMEATNTRVTVLETKALASDSIQKEQGADIRYTRDAVIRILTSMNIQPPPLPKREISIK